MSKGLSESDKKALRDMMDIPAVEEAIRARLPNLIQAMIDLAEGVQVQEGKVVGDMWVERVYRVKPDRLALQFLIENVIGKVPTRVEMTGNDGGPLQVVPWIPKLAAVEQGILDAEATEVKMLKEARDAQA